MQPYEGVDTRTVGRLLKDNKGVEKQSEPGSDSQEWRGLNGRV